MSRPTDHPPVRAAAIGVLLINLGTPDAPDARRGAALSRRVPVRPAGDRDPGWLWQPILHGVVLRTRPASRRTPIGRCGPTTARRSPRSPTARREALQQAAGRRRHCRLRDALRQPGYRRGDRAHDRRRLHAHPAAPLYPQYCAATTATANDAVSRRWPRCAGSRRCARCRHIMTTRSTSPRCAPISSASLPRSISTPERLLLSFHGMPQRTLELGDPYHCHCQKTARLLGEALGRPVDVAFQSRFGRAKWLEPATDATLAAYPAQGVQANRHRRARFLRRLPRDAGGARHPRPRHSCAPAAAFRALDCLNDRPKEWRCSSAGPPRT